MSTPDPIRQATTLQAAWPLALVLLLVLMLGLGAPPLFDVDEGAFSEATREMLASGDWGHTTLHGADRFDKPIGVYWLQAISASLFGLNEFAMRLPSALATWLAAMALWAFVTPRWGRDAGALAAVIQATGLGTWAMAHAATADALLGLCLMLSALDLWRYLESAQRSAVQRLGCWVGLGLLVKGPVAVLIPAACLLLVCLTERRWQALWGILSNGRAWLGMLGVALPWYAYALWRHGQAFVDGFFLHHNLHRFSAPMEGHSGVWFYFLLVAPLLWMPWSPLLCAWKGRAADLWADLRVRRALLWALFVLVFFSVSSTKLPHYGLYAAPGIAIVLVAALDRAQPWLWWVCGACLGLWHAVMVGVPWVWTTWPGLAPSILTDLLPANPSPLPWLLIPLMWAALALTLWMLKQRDPGMGPLVVLSFMALLHAGVMALLVWPWWANTLQGPIKTLALEARNLPGQVGQAAGNWPSFAFYREQAMVKDRTKADMLLVPLRQASAYPGWQPVARAQGMLLLRKPAKEASP